MRSSNVITHLPENGIKAIVILIHGLIRSARSLKSLRTGLLGHNFATVSLNYPSRSATIAKLAQDSIPKALHAAQAINPTVPVHFVTHSMGAILLRAYLQQHRESNIGRIVMIAPPNQGSEVVDKLSWVPGFRLINGPAGFELGTGDRSVPKRLGPVTDEVGIIAGVKSVNPILSFLLPKPNDGKVSLESTKVEGMTDFWIVNASHTFILNRPDVMEQTVTFLEQGRFLHEPKYELCVTSVGASHE